MQSYYTLPKGLLQKKLLDVGNEPLSECKHLDTSHCFVLVAMYLDMMIFFLNIKITFISMLTIQEAVMKEQMKVLNVKHVGEEWPALTYDDIKEMQLLDRCIKETLRLRPPIMTMMRMCKTPQVRKHVPTFFFLLYQFLFRSFRILSQICQ